MGAKYYVSVTDIFRIQRNNFNNYVMYDTYFSQISFVFRRVLYIMLFNLNVYNGNSLKRHHSILNKKFTVNDYLTKYFTDQESAN